MDDAALIEKILEGNPGAFASLYRRYSTLVYRFVWFMLRDSFAAEEITQDVFMRIWQKAHTYRPEQTAVATWLIRIARNRAIDELRRIKSRPEKVPDTSEIPDISSGDWSDPHHKLAYSWEVRRIREAVDNLPPECREPLTLAFFAGHTHVQIAKILDLSLGTVKTRIRMAMRQLRRVLDAESVEPSKPSERGYIHHA